MSINKSSALSNDKNNAALIIRPSIKNKTLRTQPTPKDILVVAQNIANIYTTSYTKNTWTWNLQNLKAKKKTSPNALKFITKNNTLINAQKTWAYPLKFINKNKGSANAQKSLSKNNISVNAQKSKTQPKPKDITAQSIANTYRTSSTKYPWTYPLKFITKKKTPINPQKNTIQNHASTNAQKSLSTNNTSANARKSVSTNNSSAYLRKSKTQTAQSIANIYTTSHTKNSGKNIWTSSQKITSQNNTLAIKPVNANYNAPKSIIKNSSSTRNYNSPYSQSSLRTNNSSSYARNYISPYSQGSLRTNNSSNYAQKSIRTFEQAKGSVDFIHTERLKNMYKEKASNAFKNRLIFSVHGGYFAIRNALWDRGWLEKLDAGWFPMINKLSDRALLRHAKRGNDYERLFISRMLYNYPAFFVWQPRYFNDQYFNAKPVRCYINRSKNLDFSSKVGLIGCFEKNYRFQLFGPCVMSSPRCYPLENPEKRTKFIEDYRRTQCRNLVRFVIENITMPDKLINMRKGTILPAKTLTYAIEHLEGQLNEWKYLALEMENDYPAKQFNYDEWIDFLISSQNIIRGRSKFKTSIETLKKFATIAKEYLDIIEERRPDYKWDGVRNLWILKPSNECRGVGIVVKMYLDEILYWAAVRFRNNYVVQKYIERPLLIYNTKFDIRQYMIISIGNTDATIWLYKDCYLKFSSQVFSLDNLSESIHLTNNTVQVNYAIDKNRDRRLPATNMWSLEYFINYLKWINAPADIWSKKIYAGFKENLIGVVLASFEGTQFVPNTFELYGCDFMLDWNYNPILIEINHTPDMYASTPVTARLCPMVLYDLIKVVIDVPNNPNAPTGLFELVHRVNYKNLNASGKAKTTPQLNKTTSGKSMTAAQESLNTIGKTITVAQVNTSGNTMPVTQKNLNAIVKNYTVPQGNSDGNDNKVTQESLSTISKATTDPQVNTSGNSMTVSQGNLSTSSKAMTVPEVNTSGIAVTELQESLNASSKAMTVPEVNTSGIAVTELQESSNANGKAMTVPQVNTTSSAMNVSQESLNTIRKSLTDPQVNTRGNDIAALQEDLNTTNKAIKDTQDNTIGNAETDPQKSLNTVGKALTDPQVNTSDNNIKVPQESLNTNGTAMTVPPVNTSSNAMTELEESLNTIRKSLTDPKANSRGNDIAALQKDLNATDKSIKDTQYNTIGSAKTVPQKSLNTVRKALTDPQVYTSSNAVTVPQESLNTIRKSLTDPQVNTSGNAMAALQEGLNTTSKAMKDSQVNTSGNATTAPKKILNNSAKKVKKGPYKVSLKDMTTQQQAAKKVEARNAKERYYQKLFAKRLELTNFLRSLKS